jgi:hypothetical protein
MQNSNKSSILRSTRFQVIAAWVFNLLAAGLVSALVSALLPDNIAVDQAAMRANPSLAYIPILTEIIAVGLLPIIFVILNKEKAADYGLHRQGLYKGLGLSAILVIAFFAYLSFRSGGWTTTIHLEGIGFSQPLNVLPALIALLAYGPLEVFFVLWLIQNTDKLFKPTKSILSYGLIITIVIYDLLHTFTQGSYSIVISILFLAIGLIYKYTRNAIGPMIAWTLMNGYLWFLVGVFLIQN